MCIGPHNVRAMAYVILPINLKNIGVKRLKHQQGETDYVSIHLAVRLTTGQKPLTKRALHIM
jgi:hypothetical protein